jgi:hypothetical protein
VHKSYVFLLLYFFSDGNNYERLYEAGSNQPYELTLDTVHKRVYWTDQTQHTIFSMALDGGAVTEMPIAVAAFAAVNAKVGFSGIAVDPW